MQNERKQVKTFSAEICKPVRKMDKVLLRLSKMLVNVKNKMVHVVGWLVAVVEQVLLSGRGSVVFLFKARKLFHVFNAELDERRDILNIVHALPVCALAHHREFSAGNLAQEVVHISTVLLAKNHGRADYWAQFDLSEESQSRYFPSARYFVRP